MQQSQTKSNYLGEEKIHKLLLKFSIPCILSLVVSALYNIVDQIFIGNSELGYLGNAATGVVFPTLIVALAFAWCFGDGAAAYLSICQGKKDTGNAHKCIGTSIVVTLAVGLILMLICFLLQENILRLFGASNETLGLATEYFTIVLCALPVYMLMNMMNSVIRADGSPAFSMLSMTSGAVINIILDPVFIYGLHWGIKGAAYATIIGEIVSFIISLVYFTKTKSFKLALKSFIPDFKIFRRAAILGASTFITQMSIVVISLVCNIMLFKYGTTSVYGPDIPIAVISIETKVFTIIINITVGIILGGQPILGYNYGAKNNARVKETYKIIMFAVLAVGIISTLIIEIFPQSIIGIFGKGDELYREFAEKTFRIFLSLVIFTCLIKMTSIFFQAVGKPIKAAVSSLIRDIICFVPAVIILPLFFGIDGILYAAPLADIIAMVVATALTVNFFRSLGKKTSATSFTEEKTTIKASRPGVIVTIARQHGSMGKQVGRLLAEKLNIPFYYKELTALAAEESGLDKQYVSDLNANSPSVLHDLYLSCNVVRQAIAAQTEIIQKIANAGSCVIVGRAADYVLRNNENVVKVFVYAPKECRTERVCNMYNDSREQAIKSIKRADEARSAYYKNISDNDWGRTENYDLCIDSSIGIEATASAIYGYLQCKATKSDASREKSA